MFRFIVKFLKIFIIVCIIGVSLRIIDIVFYKEKTTDIANNNEIQYEEKTEVASNEIDNELQKEITTEKTKKESNEEQNKKVVLLQEKGCRVSLDDFGSGYSSLNTLARLHINELKLDRGFLMNMSLEDQERGTLIIKKVIQMAKDLDISVVAEGVETPEDQELLRALQCDIGQGYLYSKPVEAEEFDEKFMIVKASEKEEN